MGDPVIAQTGFREYDLRWRYPQDVNLAGMTRLGQGIGTLIVDRKIEPAIVVGHDYRDYAPAVKAALVHGLVAAGIKVLDVGLSLSPMVYFARHHLGLPAMAMVTASHNPNGWTGIKAGFGHPFSFGPDDVAELREILATDRPLTRPGGSHEVLDGIKAAYLDDVAGRFHLTRKLRVVCATGNGTAGLFAPEFLQRIGAEVIPRYVEPDFTFPHYNPNPELLVMLNDMAQAVRSSGADLAIGFDGDGDRCGLVDDKGVPVFADKCGALLARDMAPAHPGARIVADIKSTGILEIDPVLGQHGIAVDYWKTGHSHMKRRIAETGAVFGFERSAHFYFAPPIGHGYDCGLTFAREICGLLDRNPASSLSGLVAALPHSVMTPTLSADCPDDQKYQVVDRIDRRLDDMANTGETIAGRQIRNIIRINGARVQFADHSWALVRASSNTPSLVVICETTGDQSELRKLFQAFDRVIRSQAELGEYDQEF